jgi:hypothetical protein
VGGVFLIMDRFSAATVISRSQISRIMTGPQSNPEHVKVFFRLEPDEDGYPPVEVESLWGLRRSKGVELDNIPFYARGVALGDVVAVKADPDGVLWFDGLVRASGHSTIRLWFAREDDVQSTCAELRTFGCSYEGDLPRLVAIDIPPNVPYDSIREYLDRQEAASVFEYEEACLGQTWQ